MKMLARVPGQSFQLAHGPHYFADAERVVYVEAADVAEMRRLGCVEAPAEERSPEVEQIIEGIKEAHRTPIAYVAMPDASDTPESYGKQAAAARAAIDLARGAVDSKEEPSKQ